MLQLIANDDPGGLVGKPAVGRSAMASLLFHGGVFLFLAYLQFSPAVLPTRFNRIALTAPAPPLPPPPPAPVRVPASASRTAVTRSVRFFSPVLQAPAAIPVHALEATAFGDAPPQLDWGAGVAGGIPGGVPGGIPGGTIAALPPAIAPPAPKPEPKHSEPPAEAAQPTRIHVDSEIQEAKLLNMVQPAYPEMAKRARIQGNVHLNAVIDPQGRITELKVISGNPLLVEAARNAVARWRYSPTYLHGQAVEVITDIFVVFHLTPIG